MGVEKKKTIHSSVVSSFLENSYSNKQKRSIEGFGRDDSLSGKRVQVYRDNNGKAVVVHRGTAGMHDMVTDLKMSLGFKNSKRLKHSKNIQKQAEAKYGSDNTTTMGHSLGGALAEESSKRGSRVITLNKAAVPRGVERRIIRIKRM